MFKLDIKIFFCNDYKILNSTLNFKTKFKIVINIQTSIKLKIKINIS